MGGVFVFVNGQALMVNCVAQRWHVDLEDEAERHRRRRRWPSLHQGGPTTLESGPVNLVIVTGPLILQWVSQTGPSTVLLRPRLFGFC